MRRYRTAIVLLGGWILMLPPTTRSNVEGRKLWVDTKAPIAEWEQARAHDTAKRCEGARAQMWEIFGEKLGADDVRTIRYRLSRCIPAEHIYPPKEVR